MGTAAVPVLTIRPASLQFDPPSVDRPSGPVGGYRRRVPVFGRNGRFRAEIELLELCPKWLILVTCPLVTEMW